MDLTLNKYKGFTKINEPQTLHIDLEREEKLLPVLDLQGKIDAYNEYIKEKDECNKYRLIFTIHPFCTNVLFNRITEAVYDEGSDKAKLFLMEKEANEHDIERTLDYTKTKTNANPSIISNTSPITRDTGYSYGNNYLNYNCGIDIFNNHILREKEYVCINPDNSKENPYLNTLFDYVRDPWGKMISGYTYNNDTEKTNLHVYNSDNVYSFTDSIGYNLKEENRWFGFINKALTRVDYKNKKFTNPYNRIINYKPACSFIDLYPTREHYSFVPHYNKKRKRVENNWEYALTYPFKNVYDNYIVRDDYYNVNGILCDLQLNNLTLEQLIGVDNNNPAEQPLNIMFNSHIKHNLINGDRINLHIYNTNNFNREVFTCKNVVVLYTGNNGYDNQYYFTVRLNDIITNLSLAYEESPVNVNLTFRYEKCTAEGVCKYYLRKFKKLPNFKDTIINQKDNFSIKDINSTLLNNDFNSSLNKLAFSKTIYGDDVVQIVYNDDIDVTGLRDNLGRELSVIYLTLMKSNHGFTDWYDRDDYSGSAVEFSHCFGEVTSGFDLRETITDNVMECNVHKQHNIPLDTPYDGTLIESSDKLEERLSLEDYGISEREDFLTFYGDIVELDETRLEETVLEKICHRFNTAQRETTNPKFKNLIIDYIKTDDFEGGFEPRQIGDDKVPSGEIPNALCNNECYANLAPEGYYYQAHYPIKLKEYDTTVNVGYHTKVMFTYVSGSTIVTDTNYYMETNQDLILYYKFTGEKYSARVINVSGSDFTTIELKLDNKATDTGLDNYFILKPNILKPNTAYDLNNPSGKYVWRDFLSNSKITRTSELYDSVFTNGAIYLHKDINFYLKRQDPYGDYGLLPSNYEGLLTGCLHYADMEIVGNNKDVTGVNFEVTENNNC